MDILTRKQPVHGTVETFVLGTFLCKLKYYVKRLTFFISYHLQARQSVTATSSLLFSDQVASY